MMKFILVILFSLVALSTTAQSELKYLHGYVILLNGDTLTGRIMDRDESAFGGLLSKIKFRPDKGWRKRYGPSQLEGYKRGDNVFKSIWYASEYRMLKNYYYSEPGNGERIFVKVVYQGSLALYHREYTDEDNSMIDYIPLIKKNNTVEMARATQGIFGLKRKRLAAYFSDCPALAAALLGKSINSITELIDNYEDHCGQFEP